MRSVLAMGSLREVIGMAQREPDILLQSEAALVDAGAQMREPMPLAELERGTEKFIPMPAGLSCPLQKRITHPAAAQKKKLRVGT